MSGSQILRYRDDIPTAAILSFRLGGTDGVAIEAAKWQRALSTLGFATFSVAGDGPVDQLLPGLAIDSIRPPTPTEVDSALADADVVIVENLCSLPLNPGAAAVVTQVLAGRPALLHHHDLPWQRPRFASFGAPPDDSRWTHVTINELSRRELGDRGIDATTVYNSFDVGATTNRIAHDPSSGALRRVAERRALGLADTGRIVLQPTRALPRKNIPGGLEVARSLRATYWLLGAPEDGYDRELKDLISTAACPVILGWPGEVPPDGVAAAYAACDVVVLPSTWEGFGNPSVESAIHRRPLVVGPYPVADELIRFGFRWFGLDDLERLDDWLRMPDQSLLDHNLSVATAHFSTEDLPGRIEAVLPDL
jgi:mannosylglucosylglycerate synthase